MITTAEGTIEYLFKDRRTYVWADRTSKAVLDTIWDLVSDPEFYQAQVERGLNTMEEMDLTLETALETHLEIYQELMRKS